MRVCRNKIHWATVVVAFLTIGATASFGQLNNPGFEQGGSPQPLGSIPQWTAFGNAGASQNAVARNGTLALQIYFTETLLGQTWAASPGQEYTASAYLYHSSQDPFLTDGAARGHVILEYLNSTGGVITSTLSAPFAPSETQDVWTLFDATATAPVGTTTARIMLGIIGTPGNFSGGIFFDDADRQLGSSSTTCGLLTNPGYDDGPQGDANTLDNNVPDLLPAWEWFGGAGSGFITVNQSLSSPHSLAIAFPENLAGQVVTGELGKVYVLEGHIFNPGTGPDVLAGTAEGLYVLEFLDVSGGTTSIIYSAASAPFNTSSPKDTWVNFAVTARAPDTVTGSLEVRAFAGIVGSSVGFGGALFFDDVCMSVSNAPVATTCGALSNPGFEDSTPNTPLSHIHGWEPFGNAGLVQDTIARSGDNALQIFFTDNLVGQTWSATAGSKYSTEAYLYTPSSDPLSGTNTALQALVILQYFDATGTNELASYVSDPFTTSSPQDTWVLSKAEGTAPNGTVSARTLIGIVNPDQSFSGSVYVDDTCQTLESASPSTSCGLLSNPSYDDGPVGDAQSLFNTNDFFDWEWLGGPNSGFVQADRDRTGGQSLAITFPENLAAQEFTATPGETYVLEGYMFNPSTGPEVLAGSARGVLLIDYADINGGVTTLLKAVESSPFTTSSAKDTWVYFAVTARAPTSAQGTLRARAMSAILGTTAGFGGALFFDDLCLTAPGITPPSSSCGTIQNPGFEDVEGGTQLAGLDDWDAFGVAGAVQTLMVRNGLNALQIFFNETFVGQDWAASAGSKYSTEVYARTPSSDPLRGTNVNLRAQVLLQFYDAGDNLLVEYASGSVTPAGPFDSWVQLSAVGVAPAGTAYGRTFYGIFGADDSPTFGGSVFFDDACQALVSSTPQTCGEISNPGFDDGPTGNASQLDPIGDLPGWNYIGGTNAMFVTRDVAFDGEQSAVATFPNNLLVQDFTATPGQAYTFNGRMLTPSGNKFDTDGSAEGLLVIEFYVDGSGTPAVSQASSPFTAATAADVWHPFSVQATAPAVGAITGRVTAFINSIDVTNDVDFAGVIHFDGMCVNLGGGVSEFEQWQIDNFGSSTGPGTGPQEDFDGDGASNENEFIAGTQPTNTASIFAPDAERDGNQDMVIRWESTANRFYDVGRTTILTSDTVNADFLIIATNIPATPPENVFTDAPPAGVDTYYYRVSVTTNQP